jgi:hypothetical protein
MPFIRGRYHINPVLGEALEAAREAEASLLALEQEAQQNGEGNAGGGVPASPRPSSARAKGPIHRVEIETAEVVPAHSGRVARGFVAQIHRRPAAGGDAGSSSPADEFGASSSGAPGALQSRNATAGASAAQAARARGLADSRPETHVFSDHRDLLSFLRDELAGSHSNPQSD